MLKLDQVTIFRGQRKVIHDLSIQVEPGQIVLLKGPNGAGKTTLLKAMAGLLIPDEGKITSPTDILFLEDRFPLKEHLTAKENIRLWGNFWGLDQQDIEGMIAKTLDPSFVHKQVGQFSMGEKKRLWYIQLWLKRTIDLWLLDEPSVSIDQVFEERIKQRLLNYVGSGGMVVIAEHQINNMSFDQTIELNGAA